MVLNSASILTRSKHPIVPEGTYCSIYLVKLEISTHKFFGGVLERDNIQKIKYFYILSTFCKNIFSWKIRNFQNSSYNPEFLYTYLLELPPLLISNSFVFHDVPQFVFFNKKKVYVLGQTKFLVLLSVVEILLLKILQNF